MSTVQEAAEVLMRTGRYTEEPDSVEWLKVDAERVAAAANREEVLAALIDTGFMYDPPCDEEHAQALVVARALHPDTGDT